MLFINGCYALRVIYGTDNDVLWTLGGLAGNSKYANCCIPAGGIKKEASSIIESKKRVSSDNGKGSEARGACGPCGFRVRSLDRLELHFWFEFGCALPKQGQSVFPASNQTGSP